MTITEIRVGISLTHNLGDYSNIKPEISLTATMHPQEDVLVAVDQLRQAALQHCYYTVDHHLEHEGRPAHYAHDPRFNAVVFSDEQLVYLAPEGSMIEFCKANFKPSRTHDGHRKAALQEKIERLYPDYTLVELEDAAQVPGLPPMETVCWISNKSEKILVYGKGSTFDLPLFLTYADTAKNLASGNQYRIFDIFAEEMQKKAAALGYASIDRADPDFEMLPEMLRLKAAYAQAHAQAAADDDEANDPFEMQADDDEEADE